MVGAREIKPDILRYIICCFNGLRSFYKKFLGPMFSSDSTSPFYFGPVLFFVSLLSEV
jgi:hypothetical protein